MFVICTFYFADQWECIDILSKAGANLNASDCHYGTALHITANQGFINSTEVLLRAGLFI